VDVPAVQPPHRPRLALLGDCIHAGFTSSPERVRYGGQPREQHV
jgi:hypothetical protein